MNQRIELDRASPGMTLGAPVCDRQGSTLLLAGSVLTATTLMSLQRRGVTGIEILQEPTEELPAIAAPCPKAVMERLDYVFRFSAGQGGAELRAALQALKLTGAS